MSATPQPVSALPSDAPPPDIALFLPTLYSGGAERVQLNLAAHFADRGLRVDLVVCKYFGSLKDQVPDGVRFVSLDARKVLFAVPAYLRYLRAARPATVLSSVENANIVSCIGRMVSRHRHMLTVRLDNSLAEQGKLALQPHRWPVLAAIALTFPSADAFVAVSDGVKRQLHRLPWLKAKPIHRIYNPIIHQGFEARFAETPVLPPAFHPGDRYVLAVGRLQRQKGYVSLLRAFALVARRMPCRLVILGEGEDRQKLESLARSLDIIDRVHLLGYAANPLAYMSHAAVFVLSSITEGFGNVIVEALASGTPVISTNCPHGPKEILADGRYGMLVPTGDSRAIADAIMARMNQPRSPVSADLTTYLRRFTIDTVGERYIQALGLPHPRAPADGDGIDTHSARADA